MTTSTYVFNYKLVHGDPKTGGCQIGAFNYDSLPDQTLLTPNKPIKEFIIAQQKHIRQLVTGDVEDSALENNYDEEELLRRFDPLAAARVTGVVDGGGTYKAGGLQKMLAKGQTIERMFTR